VREFPADYQRGGEAYYPVPDLQSRQLYQTYADFAARDADVYFAGRLAMYRYYNMDEVVAAALTLAERIKLDWHHRIRLRVA
jgi:UDP-galactopyranose mutase